MALSEHDKRVLDDLERAWTRDRQRRAMQVWPLLGRQLAWLTLGCLVAMVSGVLVVIAGIAAPDPMDAVAGVIGYLLIVAAAWIPTSVLRHRRQGR